MTPPVLLLAWRRPDSLRRVINALRTVAPSRVFIACDGPNPARPGEAEKVFATRSVIDSDIDWPCHIERLYSDVNQGCRLGVSRAITWFFDHVDEGIILEDDCVPHPHFFSFCTTLLERYRNETRVWCISGNNFQDSNFVGDGDYFFSQIPMCWGWATWRSRWVHYDSNLDKWSAVKDMNLLPTLFPDAVMRKYWNSIWEKLSSLNKPDSWAYRWAFTCVVERGLTALPRVNLVENVGFGGDATHTTSSRSTRPALPLPSTFMVEPTFISSLTPNDLMIFDNHFGGKWMRFPMNLLKIALFPVRKFLRFVRFYEL